MSERMSDRLTLEAAYEAHGVFERMQNTQDSTEQAELGAEYITLLDIAGIRFAQPHETEPRVEERLKMTMSELMADLESPSGGITILGSDTIKMRLINILDREKLSLRDTLTIGLERLNKLRNFGDKAFDTLQDIKEAVVPGAKWPARTDGACAAKFYASLDEVPARVVDDFLDDTPTSKTVVTGINTVEDLRNLDDTTLFTHIKKQHFYRVATEEEVTGKVQELRRQIRTFIAEYEAAARSS